MGLANGQRRSSSVSIVISQQTAEPLTTLNFASVTTDFISPVDDLVVEPLVVAFFVVMVEASVHSTTKGLLAEEDHPIQCIGFLVEASAGRSGPFAGTARPDAPTRVETAADQRVRKPSKTAIRVDKRIG